MPRESKAKKAERAKRIVKLLFKTHPDANCELQYVDPFELISSTILSAQCTDKVVNTVTPGLFAKYPNAAKLAKAPQESVEKLIRRTGFYRNKAKNLIGMAKAVMENHGGQIPKTLEELVKLPGVGRKTANVVLGSAFDTPGLVVDTHVTRLANRMGLTKQHDAVKIEHELMELIDEKDWTMFSHAMIFHGRRICPARTPLCDTCPIYDDCWYPKSK